ncbi:MAG: ABC transporter permease [Actinobacteria bacterium]|nr:ABC transporter permease [Actinomycetota bacterium]
MVDVARRNLFQEKLRFAISSSGVALAIMLILLLNGFLAGTNRQVTAYLDNEPVDLIVAQKDLKNFVGASSVVPLSTVKKVEDVKGVEKVIPVFASYVVLDIKGRKVFTQMIGYDRAKGGGPWQMAEGRSNLKDDEVIFDRTHAWKNDLKLGDKIKILGKEFTIVGLSGGTSTWMTGTFFIPFDSAAKLRQAPGTANFLFVSAAKGTNIDSLRKDIAGKVDGLSVVSKEQVAARDVELFTGVFSGPLRLMVAISFLIGLMLVGLTIYTATVERAKEYGVLKAIGTRNRRLYLIVFEQALVSALVGSILGLALVFGAAKLIEVVRPQFLILVEWSYIARVLPLALVIGILASYVPVRTVARIDPAIAFRRGA